MDNDIILDYSDYYEDTYEDGHYGEFGEIDSKIYLDPRDPKNFFKKRGHCPFCNKGIPKVYNDLEIFTMSTDNITYIDIWECDICGWWEYYRKFTSEYDLIDGIHESNWHNLKYAIVKKFDISDKEIPINTLMNELQKKKDILYNIDPYKLEDIAQVVFSSYFNCEVKHVGKTGDGGTDLIIVNSDNPILVQVKRRSNPDHVELVKGIREFVGTMYIEGRSKGIYLSTAKRFSKGSKETSDKLINDRKLERFDLINYEQFCEMLGVIKKDDHKPWKKFIK